MKSSSNLSKKSNNKKQPGFKKNFITVLFKSIAGFARLSPVLVGVILLIGLFNVFVSRKFISSFFTGNSMVDSLLGSVIGSISTGNPITSYIIAGGLLESGVSLFAVTSFIMAWVTVGIIQFPAEASVFGKKFAVQRNILCFIFSMVIAAAVVYTLMLFK